jgi:hypothetical protein
MKMEEFIPYMIKTKILNTQKIINLLIALNYMMINLPILIPGIYQYQKTIKNILINLNILRSKKKVHTSIRLY